VPVDDNAISMQCLQEGSRPIAATMNWRETRHFCLFLFAVAPAAAADTVELKREAIVESIDERTHSWV
jgi:hypothetical protein